ncbi:Protein of unknown function [Propionibacterium freudenreichii]|uniref:hypothetical protein n=1 Tax=Propionibacterium freudenreichii TaxID=1744 RepID=UPI00054400F2|nr:hypothetical protein [Propionibacterium freudenreichii]CEH10539.1 Protein of unknown function [Propionibacterium freudenreichii]SBW75824.1 Hypothetical protein PFR_JS22-1_176 [Propionibacterium freudenreichii]
MTSPFQEPLDIDAPREAALKLAVEVVSAWRRDGRVTTTAGLSSALKQSGIEPKSLGFPAFKDFWQFAEERKMIFRHRAPSGHWLIMLPGEDAPDPDAIPTRVASPRTLDPAKVRLKAVVWRAFVVWDEAYARFWDRETAEAFMVPSAWVPSQVDDTRYLRFEPITQATQIAWMREFAETHDGVNKQELLEALEDNAPLGAFRKALSASGSLRDWHATLTLRVAKTVLLWCQQSGVPETELVEPTRRKTSQPVPSSVSDPYDVAPSERTHDARSNLEAELRAAVHRAVDQMSLDELAALPVRACHLVH